jgi:hypothetical protein
MQRENKTEGEKYLKQAHGIGDIVAHPSLARNPNLIRINRRVRSRLLHSLVPIHLLRQNNFHNRKAKTKTTKAHQSHASEKTTTIRMKTIEAREYHRKREKIDFGDKRNESKLGFSIGGI